MTLEDIQEFIYNPDKYDQLYNGVDLPVVYDGSIMALYKLDRMAPNNDGFYMPQTIPDQCWFVAHIKMDRNLHIDVGIENMQGEPIDILRSALFGMLAYFKYKDGWSIVLTQRHAAKPYALQRRLPC